MVQADIAAAMHADEIEQERAVARSKPPLVGRMRSGLVLLVALVICLPVLAVAWLAWGGDADASAVSPWAQMWSTVLPGYIWNTLRLSLSVALGVLVVGVGAAWIVTLHDFPLRGFFRWALLLPLAMPAYVVAFVYTDFLDYAGPVQTGLRALFGWTTPADYWFPQIRSLEGATAVMIACFYPYVYLLTRSALIEQSQAMLEVGRTLGAGGFAAFRRIALPLAWPSVMVGLTLALMETVSDFGVVDFFAVQTLTSGLYNVWLVLGDRAGAAQVAVVLLAMVALIVFAERHARAKRAYFALSTRQAPVRPKRLRGPAAIAAIAACALPLTFGFVLPAGLLLRHAIARASAMADPAFLAMVGRSLALGAGAALLTVGVALGIAYAMRLGVGRLARSAVRMMTFGYAVPGPVLALGVLIPFAAVDRSLNALLGTTLGL